MEEKHEQEIDLMELIVILFQRWYVIASAVLVIASLTFVYAFVVQADVYTARSSVLVDVTLDQQADRGDLTLAQELLDIYTDVAESNTILGQLRETLDLPYSNNTIREMLTVSRGRGNSILLNFSFESGDPEEAALMANEIVSLIRAYADDSNILYDIEILDEATTPLSPSGPNRMLYMAIGVVLGGMIGVFGVFIIEFFDKTIKSTKVIEQRLGLRSLGTIPEYDMGDEVEGDVK